MCGRVLVFGWLKRDGATEGMVLFWTSFLRIEVESGDLGKGEDKFLPSSMNVRDRKEHTCLFMLFCTLGSNVVSTIKMCFYLPLAAYLEPWKRCPFLDWMSVIHLDEFDLRNLLHIQVCDTFHPLCVDNSYLRNKMQNEDLFRTNRHWRS